MFFSLYYELLGLLLLPGIILGIWAQSRVTSNFNKYNQVQSNSGTPAHKLARHLLDSAGLYDIQVRRCNGNLTDNFNPKTKTVNLSETVYDSSSVASLGVMAHEVGHVLQDKDNYWLLKLRLFLVPVINFSSFLIWPLVIIGLIIEFTSTTPWGTALVAIGIGIFALSTLFSLITLPIELDASKRAEKLLIDTGILNKEEGKGVKAVLKSAALTYVAALITSILSLLRFLLFIISIRRND